MSDTIRKKAEAALAEVEKVTAVVLAEPKGELVTMAEADKPTTTVLSWRSRSRKGLWGRECCRLWCQG